MGLMATVLGHGPHRGVFRGAVDGAKIGWFAPIYGTRLEELWRELKRATWACTNDKSEVEKRIEVTSGGEVICRSLHDPNNARGPGWDGIVIDEAAYCKEEAWTEVLRPALADREGWAIFISTPNGHNWFYDLFMDAQRRQGWAAWQQPSSTNPTITAEELEEWKHQVGPRAFAQEGEGLFMEVEGALFPGSYFPESIWFDEWPDLMWRVMACDPSMGKSDRSDYSAIVSLGLDASGTMWADADIQRRPPAQIVRDCYGRSQRFGPVNAFAFEANQFQEVLAGQLVEHSRGCGMALPIVPVTQKVNKTVRIARTLDPHLARGEIRFRNTPGGRLLVKQLQEFPEGKHDDGPDALEMAVSEMRVVFGSAHFEPETEQVEA